MVARRPRAALSPLALLCFAVVLLCAPRVCSGRRGHKRQAVALHYSSPRNGAANCTAALVAHLQTACEDADGRVHIAFTGEFGSELIWALPAAYAAWQRGALGSTRGCGAVAPFYWFSPNHVDDVTCKKSWRKGKGFSDLHARAHSADTPPRETWWPPPLRAHYRRLGLPALPAGARLDPTRPLVVLHNKYSKEWNKPPVNFFSLPLLADILAILAANDLQSLYIRHGHSSGFEEAGSNMRPFGDYDFLRAAAANGSAPGLLLLDDVAAANPEMPLNEVQLRMLAAGDHGVSVQGGPSLLLAQFFQGGDLVVLHRRGHEAKSGEYGRLFERFDGARITVARTEDALRDTIARLAPQWAVE